MDRTPPRIVLSYRRSDSAAMAGRVCDQLVARYGAASVFMDVDHIPYGTDFRDYIRDFLVRSDVLLAVVGPEWRGAGEAGARIEEADDPVRAELEIALGAGVPVIPVLVGGARMPAAAELPPSLEKFAFINAAPVDSGRDFRHHLERVVESIDAILARKGKATGVRRGGAADPVPLGGLGAAIRRPDAWALGGAVALAFAGGRAGLAPPWPPGLVVITALAVLLGFALARHLARGAAARTARRAGAAAAAVLGVAGFAYLLAVSLYTYQTPTTGERWAKGFVCTAEALAVFPDKCPALGLDELRMAEYEAERLWTTGSVTAVRIGLLALWLAGFAALAALVAAFAAERVPADARAGPFARAGAPH